MTIRKTKRQAIKTVYMNRAEKHQGNKIKMMEERKYLGIIQCIFIENIM